MAARGADQFTDTGDEGGWFFDQTHARHRYRRELAAVYVPTSPNPTSGYIEIVPLDEVVQTDWSFEEAMSFVMTGGANAPDRMRYIFGRDKARYQASEQNLGSGEPS